MEVATIIGNSKLFLCGRAISIDQTNEIIYIDTEIQEIYNLMMVDTVRW